LAENTVQGILAQLSLDDARGKAVREFSLGMKRRLQLGMATLIRQVNLYILDEPTNGLDMDGLIWLKQHLVKLREDGATLLIATHAIRDLEEQVTGYAILDKGKLLTSGRWSGSGPTAEGWVVVVRDDQRARLIAALNFAGLNATEPTKGRFEIAGDLSYQEIFVLLARHGVEIETVGPLRESLADVFRLAVGEDAQ
jgi:ABC-2 type transport system ATP-binding protein